MTLQSINCPVRNIPKARGFALVVTLTLLVLLALLALGLLSLSAVTLRSGSRDVALTEARANARFALMIAIGELQKQMGPDQRVFANGAILSENPIPHPHWTGVWDSWVAGPTSAAPVNSGYPSAGSHHQTIGEQPAASMHPDYANKDKHFSHWLLSLNADEAIDPATPTSHSLAGEAMATEGETAVRLVGQGSLGESASDMDYVSARLIDIKPSSPGDSRRSRYAWWVGDESQKARVMADPHETDPGPLATSDKIFRAQAPGSMANAILPGLGGMTDETQLDGLPSLKTLDLVSVNPARASDAPALSQLNFHHATAFSNGVLADVREGGLKRDLSTLLEREIKLEEDGDEFMLYRFDKEGEDRVPLQDLSAYHQLYHNDPDRTSGKRGGIEHNADSSRVMQVNAPDYGNRGNRDKLLREYTSLYRSPVPVRVQFVVGVGATAITDAEREAIATPRKSYATPTDTRCCSGSNRSSHCGTRTTRHW